MPPSIDQQLYDKIRFYPFLVPLFWSKTEQDWGFKTAVHNSGLSRIFRSIWSSYNPVMFQKTCNMGSCVHFYCRWRPEGQRTWKIRRKAKVKCSGLFFSFLSLHIPLSLHDSCCTINTASTISVFSPAPHTHRHRHTDTHTYTHTHTHGDTPGPCTTQTA